MRMRGRGGSSGRGHGDRRRRRRTQIALQGKSECLALALASLTFVWSVVAAVGDASEAQDAAAARGEDASFPPGCSWECYLDDNPELARRIPHTEEAALDHYLRRGKGFGMNCTCKGKGRGWGDSTNETDKQEFIHDIAAGRNDTHAAEEKADLEASFPPGCTWECYLANYARMAIRFGLVTEEAALEHYLTHGIKSGRDCTCRDKEGGDITNPVLASINGVDETLTKLDFLDDDAAVLEVAHLEQLEEEKLEDSFPPGCSWECYLANYKSLTNRLPQTEAAALNHYLIKGLKQGRDCSCKEDAAAADPSLEPIVEVEQELTRLDFQDDDGAAAQAEILEEEVEEMVANSFPPGCSWECYLANYKSLQNRLPQTEAAALDHYLTKGIRQGRDCSCKEEDAAADPLLGGIEEVEQELTHLDFLDDDHAAERGEELEEQEGEMLADSFPPGCSWECYLDNYKALAKRLPRTEAAALRHYLTHGVKQGRDCSCRDEDGGGNASGSDPTSEKIEEVEEELIGLDFQDDDASEERADELERLKQELMQIKKSEHDTRFALLGAMLVACPVTIFILWRQRRHNIRLRDYKAVPTEQRTGDETADGFERAGGPVEGTLA